MSDPREKVQRLFDIPHRYNNFGEILVRMNIKGFRCHTDTVIEVKSPITAICGLNGTGKSTILQLAAVAYRDHQRSYTIRDFFIVGTLDPNPFRPDASIEYRFWQEDRTELPRTISKRQTDKLWNGYNRRLHRPVFFTGVGKYLPRIEQRDFIINKADKLVVSSTNTLSDEIHRWTSNILGVSYDKVAGNKVIFTDATGDHIGEVVSVQRAGHSYSETHMGFGEGRTQYLISVVENLPSQSLVLIEEPETSLHPSAQYQFGHYLLDALIRKKHQIILTTHSPFILKALPTQSRLYLKRSGDHIEVLPNLSPGQIRSHLAEGHEKALIILVEDECGAAILREMIRSIDQNFLESVEVHPAGAWQDIVTISRALHKSDLPIAAVLDGDQKPEPKVNVFSLPGEKKKPEVVLFNDTAVINHMRTNYHMDLPSFVATVNNIDPHGWFERLANRLNIDENNILGEVARAYANAHEVDALLLTQQLKAALP
jgi:predicted ATPase